MTRPPLGLSAALATVLLTTAILGRQQSSAQTPVFKAGVDLVRLNVRVLGKDKAPVRGLVERDFSIRVDDVEQPIVALAELAGSATPATGAAWTRDVAADVATNEGADHNQRLWVIIMDDCTLPGDPWKVQLGKTIARDLVAGMGPEDKAAVVFTWYNRPAQEFTTSRAKLRTAIDTFTPGPGLPPPCDPKPVIRQVWDFLADLDNPRASIVYIGVGPERQAQDAEPRMQSMIPIPFYGFSLWGLVPSGPTAADPHHPGMDASHAQRSKNSLQILADYSGGFTIADTNAPASAVPRLLAETGSSYLIGFHPTYPLDDGRYRRLKIRVDRPNVTVEPGEHVFETSRPVDPAKPIAPWQSLTNALSGLLPDAHSPLRVNVLPFNQTAAGKGGGTGVAIVLGVQLPDTPQTSSSSKRTIDLETVAFDSEGRKQLASQTQRVDIPLGASNREYDFLSQLTLKPGRYNLRFAMNGSGLDLTGSVYTDIIIPDFAKDPVSVSGLVLTTTPAAPALPRNAFSAFMPVVPTTRRDFADTDHVEAFLRVYQGGTSAMVPVTLHLQITDEEGHVRRDHVDVIAAGSFGSGRTSDWQQDLMVASLTAGKYLLSIEAVAGNKTSRREVIFNRR